MGCDLDLDTAKKVANGKDFAEAGADDMEEAKAPASSGLGIRAVSRGA